MREPDFSKRWVFYIPPDQSDENGFVPSIVVEGEPGHWPLDGGPHGRPWYWGHTREEAAATASKANAERGVSEAEAIRIVFSSMRAGEVAS